MTMRIKTCMIKGWILQGREKWLQGAEHSTLTESCRLIGAQHHRYLETLSAEP